MTNVFRVWTYTLIWPGNRICTQCNVQWCFHKVYTATLQPHSNPVRMAWGHTLWSWLLTSSWSWGGREVAYTPDVGETHSTELRENMFQCIAILLTVNNSILEKSSPWTVSWKVPQLLLEFILPSLQFLHCTSQDILTPVWRFNYSILTFSLQFFNFLSLLLHLSPYFLISVEN